MTPSQDYVRSLAESTKHHASSKTFSGRFLRPHRPFIKEIVDRLGIKTILDYGCGKGGQYTWVCPDDGLTLEQFWGVEVTKYDPAYPPFAAEPTGKFDLVICTHTLGSIPVKDLTWVVDRLYRLATKALYVSEKIGPVKKQVFSRPDVMPIGWDADQWKKALARPASMEVVLTTREKLPDGVRLNKWALCGSEFLAVGGTVAPSPAASSLTATR